MIHQAQRDLTPCGRPIQHARQELAEVEGASPWRVWGTSNCRSRNEEEFPGMRPELSASDRTFQNPNLSSAPAYGDGLGLQWRCELCPKVMRGPNW